MNLHGIVRGAITTVNPDVPAQLLRNTGNTVNAAGKQTPIYATAEPVQIQVQALTAKELTQIEYLNIQGVLRAVYMFGNTQGIVRPTQKGGDILQFPEIPDGPVVAN